MYMGERLTESLPRRMISDSRKETVDHDQQVPALSCDFTEVFGRRLSSVKTYPSFVFSFFFLLLLAVAIVAQASNIPSVKDRVLLMFFLFILVNYERL